jgi:SOS response regulatory protein OraA/RecX
LFKSIFSDDVSDGEDNIDWMDDSEWTEDQEGEEDFHRQRNRKGPSNVQKLLDRLNLKMTYRNQANI